MNDNQIKELIKRIVEEVLARISGFWGYSTVALLTEVSAYEEETAKYLSDKKAVAAIFGDAEEIREIDSKRIKTAEDKNRLIKTIRNFEEVILAAPSLKLLCAAAKGDESEFAAKVFSKAILDGKKTTVLLDFQPPKFKRGTLFEKAVSAIEALQDMGVEVVYLGSKPDEGYALITEYEVNEAVRRGIERLQCAPGAIITPLARDAAKDKGIAIDI